MKKIMTLSVVLLLFSCSKQNLEPSEYVSWYAENRAQLGSEQTVNGLKFSLQYRPLDQVLLQDIGKEQLSETEIAARREALSGFQHFTLRISAENFHDDLLKYKVAGSEEYASRVQYFAFGLQQDLRLVDGTDTLSCLLCQYERNFGLSPATGFSLAFPASSKKNETAAKTLVFDDKVFGTGKVKLRITAEQLSNLPHLILK